MTQEIKQKLEQAAKTYFNGDGSDELSPFKAGAQTILENPGEWGLIEEKSLYSTLKSTVLESENKDIRVNLMSAKIKGLQSQLTNLQSELEFYKRRADHDPNSPFNKIADAVDRKLTQILDEQKKAGKKFISDEEVDQLIDKIVREELGNDTGRS